MKKIAIVLIIGLIALAFVIPASAAGKNGDGNGYGQMYHKTAGLTLQDVPCPNPDCPQEDCTGNKTPPRDGTGFKHSKGGFGKNRV